MSFTSSLPSHSHHAAERQRRPREPGHALDGAEEAREALDLALHVLRATLDDEVVRILARDDLLRAVTGRAEHAHRVIMREHDVAHRQIGHAANALHDVPRHHGRRLRIGDEHCFVADDDAGVRIAFRGVRIRVRREPVEAHALLREIGARCECLRHGRIPDSGRTDARARFVIMRQRLRRRRRAFPSRESWPRTC